MSYRTHVLSNTSAKESDRLFLNTTIREGDRPIPPIFLLLKIELSSQ
ncbi:MAG: hypothetical protein F6K30_11400 [Cyanothece sp. SIO2G6]|nr:hypothetical protein [Cyanothece sp. SIO2G6]